MRELQKPQQTEQSPDNITFLPHQYAAYPGAETDQELALFGIPGMGMVKKMAMDKGKSMAMDMAKDTMGSMMPWA